MNSQPGLPTLAYGTVGSLRVGADESRRAPTPTAIRGATVELVPALGSYFTVPTGNPWPLMEAVGNWARLKMRSASSGTSTST